MSNSLSPETRNRLESRAENEPLVKELLSDFDHLKAQTDELQARNNAIQSRRPVVSQGKGDLLKAIVAASGSPNFLRPLREHPGIKPNLEALEAASRNYGKTLRQSEPFLNPDEADKRQAGCIATADSLGEIQDLHRAELSGPAKEEARLRAKAFCWRAHEPVKSALLNLLDVTGEVLGDLLEEARVAEQTFFGSYGLEVVPTELSRRVKRALDAVMTYRREIENPQPGGNRLPSPRPAALDWFALQT